MNNLLRFYNERNTSIFKEFKTNLQVDRYIIVVKG